MVTSALSVFTHNRTGSMDYRRLGDSDVKVSLSGLGTMTWGEQNT